MPNMIRFRCTGINNRIAGGVARSALRTSQATITFQAVADEPQNAWFTGCGYVNGQGAQNNQFTIITQDRIAAVAFQVGHDYAFTIDEWIDTDLVEGEDEQPFFDLACLNKAARKQMQSWLAVGAVKQPTIEAVMEALEKDLITPENARTFFSSSGVANYLDEDGKLHLGKNPNTPQRSVGGISDAMMEAEQDKAQRRISFLGVSSAQICEAMSYGGIDLGQGLRELNERGVEYQTADDGRISIVYR